MRHRRLLNPRLVWVCQIEEQQLRHATIILAAHPAHTWRAITVLIDKGGLHQLSCGVAGAGGGAEAAGGGGQAGGHHGAGGAQPRVHGGEGGEAAPGGAHHLHAVPAPHRRAQDRGHARLQVPCPGITAACAPVTAGLASMQ